MPLGWDWGRGAGGWQVAVMLLPCGPQRSLSSSLLDSAAQGQTEPCWGWAAGLYSGEEEEDAV